MDPKTVVLEIVSETDGDRLFENTASAEKKADLGLLGNLRKLTISIFDLDFRSRSSISISNTGHKRVNSWEVLVAHRVHGWLL